MNVVSLFTEKLNLVYLETNLQKRKYTHYKTTFLASKMDKLQFQFIIKEAADRKTNIMCITSIGTPQGKTYEVPSDRQRLADHKGFLETDAVKRIKNTLRLRHESRKIWISL